MTGNVVTGYVAVWRYHVREEHRTEFERAYGPDGDWVALFETGEGYVGSELVRGSATGEYLTIDRWASAEAYATVLEGRGDDYAALDGRLQYLTEDETLVIQGPLVGSSADR
jgi:heme-degrading monooxygenase HmoA